MVAEAPPGTAPQARHFPRRNRIIAGLSLGVVVVEAALRSGSLITARLAQEAGREVFAVPGSPLDPRCRGANDLIRQGAAPDRDGRRRAGRPARAPRRRGLAAGRSSAGPACFSSSPPACRADTAGRAAPKLAGARRKSLDLLGPSPTAVDELIRRCQLSPGAVMAVLLELELAGRVETLPGNTVALLADPGH